MRAHSRVTVNGVSSRSWTLSEDIALAQRIGVRSIAVPINKLTDAGPIGVDALRSSGLDVATLLASCPFELGVPDTWASERARLIDAARLAARIHAGSFYITTGRPASRATTDASIDAFCSALRPALAEIVDIGVPFGIEHSSTMTHDGGCVHSLRDIIEVAEELDVGVVIELQNCWLERGLRGLFERAADRTLLVQISDFVVGTGERLHRAVPGDGDMPLEALLHDMLAAGYRGQFDIEMLGPRIEAEGYESAITRSVEWLSACLTRLGA